MNEDRWRVLTLHYIDAVGSFDHAATVTERAVDEGLLDDADREELLDDFHDNIKLAQRALLALLPPVVAPPCEVHDVNRGDACLHCKWERVSAEDDAIAVALDRIGLEHPTNEYDAASSTRFAGASESRRGSSRRRRTGVPPPVPALG